MVYQSQPAINTKPGERPSVSGKILAKGLSFEEHFEGRKLFTLKIDTVKILRKKVGFLSLGFFKVTRLENVRIDFYEVMKNPGSTPHNFLNFEKSLLSKNNLKLLKPKGVKGLEIVKITVNVYREGRLLSSICSDKAKIEFGKKEIIFEGHVRIASGEDRSLECSKIRWITDTQTFRTREHYVAKVNGRIIEGKGLETGYLLEKLNFVFPKVPVKNHGAKRRGINEGA